MSLHHSLIVVALVTASAAGIDESNPDFDISLLQVDLQQQEDFTQVESRMENGRVIGQASGGWYAGADGESCDSSCEALGLVCANNEHNAEVDTADEVKSLIAQVGGETDENFCTVVNTGCDYQPGSWKSKGTCWYCASPTTSDCGAANEKRQRLCYCDQATTTTATTTATCIHERGTTLGGNNCHCIPDSGDGTGDYKDDIESANACAALCAPLAPYFEFKTSGTYNIGRCRCKTSDGGERLDNEEYISGKSCQEAE